MLLLFPFARSGGQSEATNAVTHVTEQDNRFCERIISSLVQGFITLVEGIKVIRKGTDGYSVL